MTMRPVPGGPRGHSIIYTLLIIASGVFAIMGGYAAATGRWNQAQYDALMVIAVVLWAMAWDE